MAQWLIDNNVKTSLSLAFDEDASVTAVAGADLAADQVRQHGCRLVPCPVLPCVALCCLVMSCVAVCCRVSPCVVLYRLVLPCVAWCCLFDGSDDEQLPTLDSPWLPLAFGFLKTRR